ncbi:hypothetical protein BB934_43285 (plasmid) [Microvirga ossetica]|uniref:DUF6894 domain-containing protein n=1 Tax=Microvirga ossetica TaxID=1882682 RepID=A0A1B2EYK8_9HYPH|nr:hypothetical protein [Microvirga ossetica]ANY85036.1 hypothetical protein BB934_43285 [Microvirga ossetica]
MPRFFFDTFDGESLQPDETGHELPDLDAAKQEAQKTLPDMAKDALVDGNYRTFVVNVRDEAGQTVLRAALSLVVAEGTFDD